MRSFIHIVYAQSTPHYLECVKDLKISRNENEKDVSIYRKRMEKDRKEVNNRK